MLPDGLDPYGKYIAKIDAPAILERLKDRPNGRYIDITGITPTHSAKANRSPPSVSHWP